MGLLLTLGVSLLWRQQGAFSEKDEQLRQILVKLDNMDNGSTEDLSSEDFTAIRRQLSEGQNLLRETVERLRQSQEENDMMARRRDELEARVTTLETDYEELLGKSAGFVHERQMTNYFWKRTEKTINDEETNNVDVAEMMADLKVCCYIIIV